MNERVSVYGTGTVDTAPRAANDSPGVGSGPLGALRHAWRAFRRRRALARERRTTITVLSQLSDHQLDDIGIVRSRIPEVVDALMERQARTARTGS